MWEIRNSKGLIRTLFEWVASKVAKGQKFFVRQMHFYWKLSEFHELTVTQEQKVFHKKLKLNLIGPPKFQFYKLKLKIKAGDSTYSVEKV